jgi:hypothetical protein
MRSLPRRTIQTAEEALQRALAVGTGGGVFPLPVATEIVYVNKGGNDATADGTIARPFLTLTAALASITDASGAKPYSVQTGPGTYSDNLVLKDGVVITGVDPIAGPLLSGTFSIPADFAPNGTFGFAFVVVLNDQVYDFGAIAGLPVASFYSVDHLGNATFQGGSAGSQIFATETTFLQNFSLSDEVNVVTELCNFAGNVTTTSPNFAGTWQSTTDAFQGNISETATAGFSFAMSLTVSQTKGSLTINGVDALFSATAGGVPTVVTLLGGAPVPQLLSAANGLGYIPASLPNWSGVAPTSTANALDRIAAHVGPIP